MKVEFNDLRREVEARREALLAATRETIESGWFVLGPRLEKFEREFAGYCGANHAIGVANGTDAIELSLLGAGLRPGDEVLTTPISAAFTVLAILRAGCVPVFADVDEDTLLLDPAMAPDSPRIRAVVPVHLYGNSCRMDAFLQLARDRRWLIIEDACQAHGSTHAGRKLGTFGLAGCFSFYPTKNLGALGDGGLIVTDDDDLASRLRMLRNGGQADRYRHLIRGVNSRLDEIQAAVLSAKLPGLDDDNAKRNRIADLYRERLRHPSIRIVEQSAGRNTHLFVIRVPNRDAVQRKLKAQGVGTLIHYPLPIHRQEFMKEFRTPTLPVAENACEEILSLPVFPSLTDGEIDFVAEALEEALQD